MLRRGVMQVVAWQVIDIVTLVHIFAHFAFRFLRYDLIS